MRQYHGALSLFGRHGQPCTCGSASGVCSLRSTAGLVASSKGVAIHPPLCAPRLGRPSKRVYAYTAACAPLHCTALRGAGLRCACSAASLQGALHDDALTQPPTHPHACASSLVLLHVTVQVLNVSHNQLPSLRALAGLPYDASLVSTPRTALGLSCSAFADARRQACSRRRRRQAAGRRPCTCRGPPCSACLRRHGACGDKRGRMHTVAARTGAEVGALTWA